MCVGVCMVKEKTTYYLSKLLAAAKEGGGIDELQAVLRLDISVSQYQKLKSLFLQHPNLSFNAEQKKWVYRV